VNTALLVVGSFLVSFVVSALTTAVIVVLVRR
jgi:hypothetical protein